MKTLNLQEMENVEGGGKFFGWSCSPEFCLPNGGGSYRSCTYRAFWLRVYSNVFAAGSYPGNYS